MNEKVKQAFQTIKDNLEEYEIAEDDFNFRHIKTGKYICEEELSIVETALNQAKEQETELNELKDLQEFARIIVDKDVEMPVLMTLFRHKKLTLDNYNHNCMGCGLEKYELTQEEFDLVKKVVEKYGN